MFTIALRRSSWNMESWFLGILGFTVIIMRDLAHELSVVQETIVLVIFLGGLMGITRIPFPSTVLGKPIPLWAFPWICGLISGFMDSFLVLLLVSVADIKGAEHDRFKFRAYNMMAALIGGLITWFGEVYMMPLALQYGMRDWHSMLPMLVPVLIFLALLGFLSKDLRISILGMRSFATNGGNGHEKKNHADSFDTIEFVIAIILLLVTKNALLCLGILFLYSFITGQGEDLLDVIKTETEVAVMLLLVIAAFIAEPIAPFMQSFSGFWAFIPATINGVLMGAIYPATGDVWKEAHILSTAVLITPLSSLVGVMLFKHLSDWPRFMRLSIPLAVAWFLIAGAWFYGPWQIIEPHFYAIFDAPVLSGGAGH